MTAQETVSNLVQNLPTDLDEIEAARTSVLSDQDAYKTFENAFYDSLPEELGDDGTRLRAGTGQYILGHDRKAVEAVADMDHAVARYVRARFQLGEGRWEEALELLGPAMKELSGSLHARLLDLECRALAGDLEGSAPHLEFLQQNHPDSPSLPYAMGLVAECSGEYDEANRHYEQALVIDSNHQPSLFRVAFGHSLRGETQDAIELYERLIKTCPPPVGALINLGILYEDSEDYQMAANCFRRVLDFDPTNPRARLYFRDASASLQMFIDEERERKEDKRAQVMRIPVTDFELSVRSRNCLANMNVRTLGDLIRLSEQELLAFKNFGETSLTEIKSILAQKGLRLGMLPREDTPGAPKPVPAEIDRNSVLGKMVAELDLSVRSRKALEALNLGTIGDLANTSEARLLACKNFGQTSLAEIKKKLADLGLSLRS